MKSLPFPFCYNHRCYQLRFSRALSPSSFLSFSTIPTFRNQRPRWPRMDSTTVHRSRLHRRRDKEKVLVIVGATGTGKSCLSVDVATRFASEIINSDKMQVYKGLDITTNKIPMHERLGVPHHFIGEFDYNDPEFTVSEFRALGALTITDIISRQKLPIIAGGSNSFVHALLAENFQPDSDVFSGSGSVSSKLRYNCCFLWVDVSLPVLYDYLSKRVDDMLDLGMFEELAEFYDPEEDPGESGRRTGLRKAIGVPEFERYFRKYPAKQERRGRKNERRMKNEVTDPEGDRARRGTYEEAVREIKENTCQLAKRQIGKILKLKGAGWDLQRVDATESFRAALASSGSRREIWERQVLEPSVKIVKQFLEE